MVAVPPAEPDDVDGPESNVCSGPLRMHRRAHADQAIVPGSAPSGSTGRKKPCRITCAKPFGSAPSV